jgi:MoaA/NifB/PqqE/SkfB family radical SAM enzyme
MTKSNFLNAAEQMKGELGTALCLAKWKQVSLHLPTGLTNSCYHPPLHSIPVKPLRYNPSALHNTEHKKQMRKLMLDGHKPDECSYCWNMEADGNLSDRHYRSGEPWAAKDLTPIRNAPWDQDALPSYVEVNFNHACNLKCSYCSPQFSSSWMQEMGRFGSYPTEPPHNAPNHFEGNNRPIPHSLPNPYVDAFWAWWPTLYPELEHFRMTGGEPLMDKNTYRVFDYVLGNPSKKLHLNVTSNFSVEPLLFEQYLNYVKQLCIIDPEPIIEHFMQFVSLDGFGKQAEYMRHGLDFERLQTNVERFLNEVPTRSSLTFIVTMNNLSIPSLKELLDWILQLRVKYSKTYQRVWFDTPVLRKPEWQSLQIMPAPYVYRLDMIANWMEQNLMQQDSLFGFKDYEVQRMRRDTDWMSQGKLLDPVYVQQAKANFYRFFNEHDRRRGTNFLETFPEYNEWWSECRNAAK